MRSPLLLAFFAASLAATPAAAQGPGKKGAPLPPKEDAASFAKRGAAAMSAGNLVLACPLLSHSYELAPKLQTLFTLAECEAKAERQHAALDHYKQYVERLNVAAPAEQAREAHNRTAAEAQIAALEKSVPELTFVLPSDAPDGSIVRLDGKVAPFLKDVRVEPGEHEIALELKDGRRAVTKVIAAIGDHKSVALSLDGKAAEVPADAAAPAPVAEEPSLPPKTEEEPPPRPRSKLPAFVAAGVGVAGVATGTVFGLLAMQKANVADSHCMDVLCDPTGKQAADKAKVYGWASTGAFVVGAIGVGAAIFLFASDGGGGAKSSARAWEPLIGAGYVGARRTF